MMLSWSSTQDGRPAEVDALATGEGDAGVPFGAQLMRFVDAAVEGVTASGASELQSARAALVDATSVEFMVDAAAVIANFEMMTRVADGTGARFPTEITALADSATWESATRHSM